MQITQFAMAEPVNAEHLYLNLTLNLNPIQFIDFTFINMFLGCPQRLLVQCRRNCNYGASRHQSRIFGCYTRYGDINGRPAWTKSQYSKAIWWEPGWSDWAIGDKSDIGGKIKRAKAHRSHRCPNLIGGYYWEYYDGNRFVKAGRGLGVFGSGC